MIKILKFLIHSIIRFLHSSPGAHHCGRNYTYITCVRPHLEYAISARSLKADEITLEKVQRRVNSVAPRLKEVSLHNHGLTTLERRRAIAVASNSHHFHRPDPMVKNKRQIDKVSWYANPITKVASTGQRERLCKEAKLKSL